MEAASPASGCEHALCSHRCSRIFYHVAQFYTEFNGLLLANLGQINASTFLLAELATV